jgi:hypothetical protein
MEGYKYSVLVCGLYKVTVGRKRFKLVVNARKIYWVQPIQAYWKIRQILFKTRNSLPSEL